MTKLKFSKYFLTIAVITFLSILIYIVQTSYSNLMKDTLQLQSDFTVKNIDPNLDTDTLKLIEEKTLY